MIKKKIDSTLSKNKVCRKPFAIVPFSWTFMSSSGNSVIHDVDDLLAVAEGLCIGSLEGSIADEYIHQDTNIAVITFHIGFVMKKTLDK